MRAGVHPTDSGWLKTATPGGYLETLKMEKDTGTLGRVEQAAAIAELVPPVVNKSGPTEKPDTKKDEQSENFFKKPSVQSGGVFTGLLTLLTGKLIFPDSSEPTTTTDV